MNRKTAGLLALCGGLIAAAIILGKQQTNAGTQPKPPTKPVLVNDELDCEGAADARASADFGHGTLTAAMSTGKILRAGGGETYVSIDLAAADAAIAKRPAVSVAIVIDRSGSMEGDKMEQAKGAALALIERFGPGDRVALIQYDDNAQVLVSAIATDDAGKVALRSAIRDISVGGSTNLYDGMVLGRDEVSSFLGDNRLNRVILLSDGLANVGVVDTRAIAQTAGAAADKGIRLTTIGLGLDYNEDLMEAIAESGRGQYYYVRDAASLEPVLAGEFKAMQATVATHAELRLRPACAGVEITDVYGYEFRREGDAVVVPMADVFGGDKRKVVVKMKVPDRTIGKAGVLQAMLTFDEADTGERKGAKVAVGVETTDDQNEVDESVDKDVMGKVLEVESANQMRAAASAYEKGDSEGATRILEDAKKNVQSQATRYDLAPEAVAPVADSIGGFGSGIANNAPGTDGAKDVLKSNKSSARKLAK